MNYSHYTPDVTKQINALAYQFKVNEETITILYNDNVKKWGNYSSYQETLAFVVFARLYLKTTDENWAQAVLLTWFDKILDVIDNKIASLYMIDVQGITDFDKLNKKQEKLIVSLFTQPIFDFLKALAADQRTENAGKFYEIMFYLNSIPLPQ